MREWLSIATYDRGASTVHNGAAVLWGPGSFRLEGRGTSSIHLHLAVQGQGVKTIIARGDLLALGTSTTRDNGHIAILRLAASTRV